MAIIILTEMVPAEKKGKRKKSKCEFKNKPIITENQNHFGLWINKFII
jgi:hypothetical protein